MGAVPVTEFLVRAEREAWLLVPTMAETSGSEDKELTDNAVGSEAGSPDVDEVVGNKNPVVHCIDDKDKTPIKIICPTNI